MTAASVMNKEPLVLSLDDTVGDAVGHIIGHRYRNLPVVDGDGCYLGVFGVNCLLRLLLPKVATMDIAALDSLDYMRAGLPDLKRRLDKVREYPVSEYLYTDIPVMRPDTALMEVLLTLFKFKASLPVVDEDSGRLVGMISYWEVLERIRAAS